MADFVESPNTGASIANMSPDDMRKLYRRKVDVHEQEEDFYQQLESQRSDGIIETVTDTSVGAGQNIRFTSQAGFYHRGIHGDGNFETAAHFEKIRIAGNTLKVDWIRNGVRYNQRMEEIAGLRHELVTKIPDEMGKWLGRTKNRAIENKWVREAHKSYGFNLMVAGGGLSIDGLGGSNVLGWKDIVDVNTILGSHGAAPAYVGKVGKNHIKRYLIVTSNIGGRSLKMDEQYVEALHQSHVDSPANPLFTGGFADVDGSVILQRDIIDHDGDGALGAAIAPKVRIFAEITAGTAGFTITGGDDPQVDYTADFPNHAFKYNESDIETVGTDPFYLLVVNPPDAPVDPGKMGFYKCVGNTGASITVTERLGATGGGVRHPTVGSVTWNTGKWQGLHTDVHPAGAMAYLANAKGQPYGFSLFLGAGAMRRGYGQYRGHRATDGKEAGFVSESYIWTVFGQQPKVNVRQQQPYYMVLAHSLHYPGTPIPTDL